VFESKIRNKHEMYSGVYIKQLAVYMLFLKTKCYNHKWATVCRESQHLRQVTIDTWKNDEFDYEFDDDRLPVKIIRHFPNLQWGKKVLIQHSSSYSPV